ncbi:MAG: peptidyl-prolyl cis-trans isomerase [Pseudomonadota bacterium]
MSSRFFRKPSVHFWLLGCLLFAFDRWYNVPEDIRVIEYPDDAQVSELRQQWMMTTGRAPSAADTAQMVQYELDQRILLNEALRFNLHFYDTVVQQRLLRDMRFMGDTEGQTDAQLLEQAYAMELHVNDTVAKRRLMQAMESIYRAPGENQVPAEAELKAVYDGRIKEFTLPETRKISHVFVSRDRHREKAEGQARELYERFSRDEVALEKARLSTDPFLSGLDFSHLSVRQLSRHFGDTFSREVFNCKEKPWCGPIESPYGWHLVWVHEQKPAKPQTFEAVQQKLVYYVKREKGDKALNDRMTELRDIYQVSGGPEQESEKQ